MHVPVSRIAKSSLFLFLALAALRCSPENSLPLPQAEPSAAPPLELLLSPSNPTVPGDTPQKFVARGRFADGSLHDVSPVAEWSVTDASGQAAVKVEGGLLAGAAPGQYTVTASYSGMRISTPLLVTLAALKSLAISPVTPSIARGTKQPFTATATFTDGTTQDVTASSTWVIEDLTGVGVAYLDSTGLATGKSVGTAQIKAEYGGLSASTVLTVTAAVLVKLTLSPLTPVITKGSYLDFTATGYFSDSTTQDVSNSAAWAVTDVTGSSVAAIDGTGYSFGRNIGKATVAVAFAGMSASTTLEVKAASLKSLSIVPSSATIIKGATQQFQALANFSDGSVQDVSKLVTWIAQDGSGSAVASINASGLATANSLGSSSISAMYLGDTISASLTVGWQFTTVATPASGYLWGIWGSSTANIWAVGDGGVILRWNGTAWSSVTSPTTNPLYGIWGSGPNDIWATGANGTLLRWNGTAWSTVSAPAVTGALIGIWGISANDIWTGSAGKLFHWNGTSWSASSSPNTKQVTSVWGISNNFWAVTAPASILRWDGTSWKEAVTFSFGSLWGIGGSSASDAWAVGDSGLSRRYNGTTWTATSSPPGNLANVRSNSSTDAWATATNGKLVRWDGTAWTTISTPATENLLGLWSSGITVWATGWSGVTLRYP